MRASKQLRTRSRRSDRYQVAALRTELLVSTLADETRSVHERVSDIHRLVMNLHILATERMLRENEEALTRAMTPRTHPRRRWVF